MFEASRVLFYIESSDSEIETAKTEEFNTPTALEALSMVDSLSIFCSPFSNDLKFNLIEKAIEFHHEPA